MQYSKNKIREKMTTLFPPLTKIKRAQGLCNVRSANVVKVAGVNYLKLPCTLARGKCAHKPAASTTTGTRNVHAEIAECGTRV